MLGQSGRLHSSLTLPFGGTPLSNRRAIYKGWNKLVLLFQIFIFVLPRGRLLSTLSLPPLISGSVFFTVRLPYTDDAPDWLYLLGR